MKYKDILHPDALEVLRQKSASSKYENLGNKPIGKVLGESYTLFTILSEIESIGKVELIYLALDIIKDMYPIIDMCNIKINIDLVEREELKPTQTNDDGGYMYVSECNKEQIIKRRIINGITQGASLKGSKSFLLYKNELNHIHPSLYDIYAQMVKLLYGVYDDDGMMDFFGDPTNSDKLANSVVGVSEVKHEEGSGELTIYARATIFPILLQEIIKGLYEIISLQGFTKDKAINKQIVEKVDVLSNEPEDIRYGRFIYDAINDLYTKSKYYTPELRELFFIELYKLEEDVFISFINNVLTNKLTEEQQIWFEETLEQLT